MPTTTQKFSERKDLVDYYGHKTPELKERTKKRLDEIQELGLIETGVASFGIPGVMSGLYIERVWNYPAEKWFSYLQWIKELKANVEGGYRIEKYRGYDCILIQQVENESVLDQMIKDIEKSNNIQAHDYTIVFNGGGVDNWNGWDPAAGELVELKAGNEYHAFNRWLKKLKQS